MPPEKAAGGVGILFTMGLVGKRSDDEDVSQPAHKPAAGRRHIAITPVTEKH